MKRGGPVITVGLVSVEAKIMRPPTHCHLAAAAVRCGPICADNEWDTITSYITAASEPERDDAYEQFTSECKSCVSESDNGAVFDQSFCWP